MRIFLALLSAAVSFGPAVGAIEVRSYGMTKEASRHRPYRPFAAVALEAQHFQDTPHQPEFPTTLLRPGRTYRATTIYRFSVR